jgi:hypothetical protein
LSQHFQRFVTDTGLGPKIIGRRCIVLANVIEKGDYGIASRCKIWGHYLRVNTKGFEILINFIHQIGDKDVGEPVVIDNGLLWYPKG